MRILHLLSRTDFLLSGKKDFLNGGIMIMMETENDMINSLMVCLMKIAIYHLFLK
jgi:hypothetical protein